MIRLAAILATAALTLPAHAATVAEIVVTEGLAMRAERAHHPEQPAPNFAEAEPHRAQILQDVRAALTADPAPSGIQNELRYAAWQITGFWLAHGVTMTEIARIKEADAPARVAEAIDLMLREKRPQ